MIGILFKLFTLPMQPREKYLTKVAVNRDKPLKSKF